MDIDPYASARSQVGLLRAGDISAQDLLSSQLKRFQAINPKINAVIRTDVERAQATAIERDRELADGVETGLLHGLPMTVKDTFDVYGMPATAGAPKYARRPPSTPDAAAVTALKRSGVVIWGKSNTPYLAGDNQTFNAMHGVTRNPYNPSLTPGGSSGGSAAAIAAGMTALELGSDIGGSLRLPAHFCGVCSLKPSFGRISQLGHVPPAPGALYERQLNVVGPMARNVADLKLAFQALTSSPISIEEKQAFDLEGFRIALWHEEKSFSLSADCREAVKRASDAARALNAHVAKAKPDVDGRHLLDVYLRLVVAVLSEDMPAATRRILEIYRPLAKWLISDQPFSHAKWALYATSRYRDWVKAIDMREQLIQTAEKFFESWDAILAPVCPITAFPHNHRDGLFNRDMIVDGRREPYVSYLSWVSLASTCNLPAVVIPAGRANDGMPVGVQVIGARGQDEKVLGIAEALESKLGGFAPPSAFVC